MEQGNSRDIKLIYKTVCGEKGYITDWSPLPEDIELPPDTFVGAGINAVSPQYMGLYKSEGNKYRTSGTVGVGWLKKYNGATVMDRNTGQKCAIMIKPRFESMDPWNMLAKVLADVEYDDYVRQKGEFYTFDTAQEMIPIPKADKGGEMLAALSFLKGCEKICRRNLGRTMSFEEQNFNGKVVGNIAVSKQIKYNVVAGREDRIYCRYPVFTTDTLENRILKAALKKSHEIILRAGNRSMDIQKMYAYCVNSLKTVSSCTIIKSDFNRVKTTGCNSHYKNIIRLAQVILFQEGVSDLHNTESDGFRMTIPYTINMEQLFEFYVRSILKEYFRINSKEQYHLDEYRNNGVNPLTVFGEDVQAEWLYPMKNYIPDIAIYSEKENYKKYVAVFDVKYQHSSSKAHETAVRHNTHQLLFYTLLLNVVSCGFIFPNESGTKEENNGVPLNIQKGNRSVESDSIIPEYTQWVVDLKQEDTQNELVVDQQYKFVERMITYLHKTEELFGGE